jgi:hypothetical protein
MYQVREPIEKLEELGENKANIVFLLEKLDVLGWTRSHWVKYGADAETAFIEIYGDNSYFHIEGNTIEECYKEALERVKKLKECNHTFKIRNDTFKICTDCGQFGHATLEEMKLEFTQFSIEDNNKNKRYYSDQILCKVCQSKELIQFGLSLKDEYGYYCDSCQTVIEKRLNPKKNAWSSIQIQPIDPEFHNGVPYKEELSMLRHNVIHSLGLMNEFSLLRGIKHGHENLITHVNQVEKIIDPQFVITEKYMSDYLKSYVLEGTFNYKKDDEQYKVTDIDFTFENNDVKGFTLKLEKQKIKNKSDEEVLGNAIGEILKGLTENK